MKAKFLLTTCFSLLFFYTFAQEKRTYLGNEFTTKNAKWYDKHGYEVNSRVVTVKLDDKNTTKVGKILRKNSLGFADIEVPANVDVLAFADSLKKSFQFSSVDINTIGSYVASTPNDPSYSSQWYLEKIKIRDAWDRTRGSSCISIAIIDSGVDWTHLDLGAGTGSNSYQNIWLNPGEDVWSNPNAPNTGNGIDDDGNRLVDDWKGWNYSNNSNNTRTTNEHGTRVAGIVAAKTNNVIGIAGVAGGSYAQGVKLVPVCVGVNNPDASILDDAILYAVNQGARVINLSLNVGQTAAIDAAIQAAIANGVTIVCASGNNNSSLSYPANNSNVISVGATDKNDKRASFSNFGSNLTVAAPGVDIFSTVLNNTYLPADGTSFAAAIVSGIIGLMLSLDPTLTPAIIRDIITSSTDKVGGYSYVNGRSNELGFGRINAQKCLNMVYYKEKITGNFPAISCVNTTSTFSITSPVLGRIYNWSVTSGLQIIGSATGNSVSIKVTGNGNQYISYRTSLATICGTQQVESMKMVNVGVPAITVTTYDDRTPQYSNYTYHSAYAELLPGTTSGNYKWYESVNGQFTRLIATGTSLHQWPIPPCTSKTYRLEVTTPCGIAYWNGYAYNTNCNSTYTAYPNPASDELIIENVHEGEATEQIGGISASNSNEEEIGIKLYNQFGEVVLSEKSKKAKTTLNTKALKDGLYHLHITDKKGVTSKQQILINH